MRFPPVPQQMFSLVQDALCCLAKGRVSENDSPPRHAQEPKHHRRNHHVVVAPKRDRLQLPGYRLSASLSLTVKGGGDVPCVELVRVPDGCVAE